MDLTKQHALHVVILGTFGTPAVMQTRRTWRQLKSITISETIRTTIAKCFNPRLLRGGELDLPRCVIVAAGRVAG